ncbi:MAG: aminopeptidase P family N-terminal domain-containing protein, partial [bacterium]
MQRRNFLLRSAALAGATVAGRATGLFSARDLSAADLAHTPMAPRARSVVPITDEERRARIDKARRLMAANGIDAMVLEGGTSMYYYTGVRWGNSERTFAVVIPARGELAWVTPGFE